MKRILISLIIAACAVPAMCAGTVKSIPFSSVDITDGFWKTKQEMLKTKTVPAVYDRFSETYRFEALKCELSDKFDHHIFWDSDVAKWMEGAAYVLQKERDPKLEKIIDDSVAQIVKNADENGYFNSCYLTKDPQHKFTNRNNHELYCAGHLIEAAIAYKNATGKDEFLKAMCKYADYIEKVFKIEQSAAFVTPGHPELELALVKLYNATGEKRYLKLAEFFIDMHGNNDAERSAGANYNQDDMPLKERSTAEGHAVRAMYLMCGAADVARLRGDKELFAACKRVFDNATEKRMYVTGGIGSISGSEAFGIDYYLPSRDAYAETCAAIALALFAGRMQAMEIDSKYADVFERALYNGILSGVSMDGESFFYENPLAIDLAFGDDNRRHAATQRSKVFGCSCCPPNIVRFIPSVADYMYTYDDDTLYIHQFMNSEMNFEGISVKQTTEYPADGKIKFVCDTKGRKIAVRIPGWCRDYTVSVPYELKNGYAYIDNTKEFTVNFKMPVTAVKANVNVHDCAGRVAVTRGPVVYCAEGVDNGKNLSNVRVNIKGSFKTEPSEFLLPAIKTTGYRDPDSNSLYMPADKKYEKMTLTLIPYYAFANRGETDMNVWLLAK